MRSYRMPYLVLAAALASFLVAQHASADEKSFTLTIKDHRFSPETLTVPANEKFALTVVNADRTGEEFESNDFHVEKVIAGGKEMTFHIGPLTAGEYGFFGERDMDSALGKLFAE
jgi:hypothetical protein